MFRVEGLRLPFWGSSHSGLGFRATILGVKPCRFSVQGGKPFMFRV